MRDLASQTKVDGDPRNIFKADLWLLYVHVHTHVHLHTCVHTYTPTESSLLIQMYKKTKTNCSSIYPKTLLHEFRWYYLTDNLFMV